MRKRKILFRLLICFTIALFTMQAHGANYYWVGGTGNWSAISHWATSSGGSVFHSTVPSPTDNVIFDQNSFTGPDTVNLNLSITSCRDLNLSNAPVGCVVMGNTSSLNIYGSFLLNNQVDFRLTCPINFEAVSSGHTIHSAGIVLYNEFTFNGVGSAYSLSDSLHLINSIYLIQGEVDLNGFSLKCRDFISSGNNNRSINIESSHIMLDHWNASGGNMITEASNSVVDVKFDFKHHIADTFHHVNFISSIIKGELDANNSSFNRVSFIAAGEIFGNIVYDSLILQFGSSYEFEANRVQTFRQGIKAQGDCFDLIQLSSKGGSGFPVFFHKNSGILEVEYAELLGIEASGAATFIAHNSIDLGGNNGWQISQDPPRNLYWVGGSGQWDEAVHWSLNSGGTGGECLPRQIDNVYFDNLSFTNLEDTVFLPDSSSLASCHDMMWSATNYLPMLHGNVDAILNIHGSLAFSHGVNIEHFGITFFRSDTLGETILMNGAEFNQVVTFFNDSGGWTLLDTFRTHSVINLENGILNTNNQTVSCFRFESVLPAFQRSLYLGNSDFYLIGSGAPNTWNVDAANFNLYAGTSCLKFIKADTNSIESGMITSGSPPLTYYNVEFLDTFGNGIMSNSYTSYNRVTFNTNAIINGSATYNDLQLRNNTYCEIEVTSQQTIIDSLIASGNCNGTILIYSSIPGLEAVIYKSSGAIDLEKVALQDIHGSGGATFTASNSFDLGNNLNWNFTSSPISDRYWVGGNGNWGDTLHWSYSSGGLGGACIPTPTDNVFFDQNSGFLTTDTVLIEVSNAFCRDMSWINQTAFPILDGPKTNNLRIFGSLRFDSSMVNRFLGETYFEAEFTGNTILMNGNTFFNDIFFKGLGGGWILMDTLECNNSSISYITGDLNFNRNTVIATTFNSAFPNPRTLNMRSASLILKSAGGLAFKIFSDSLNLTADSSSVFLQQLYSGFYVSGQQNLDFWNLYYIKQGKGGSTLESNSCITSFNKVVFNNNGLILGDNIFDTLFFLKGTSSKFEQSSNQTVGVIQADGTCSEMISLRSNVAAVQATINFPIANQQVQYCNIEGIEAIGPSNVTAYESEDLGNNTGWTINSVSSKTLYWVNGQGEWSDPFHWSMTSGGIGGECVPQKGDDVIFDHNSFLLYSDSVFVDTIAFCRNMTWLVTDSLPTFLSTKWEMEIYGSLLFCDSMINAFKEIIYFKGNNIGNIINTAGHQLLNKIVFNGTGDWTFQSDLNIKGIIDFLEGDLNTDGFRVDCEGFKSSLNKSRILNFGSSEIFITNSGISFALQTTNINFDAGTSNIYFLKESVLLLQGSADNLVMYNLIFEESSKQSMIYNNCDTATFNHVSFNGHARLLGTNVFDSLTFASGKVYQLDKGHPQTIIDYWKIVGNNCFPIHLQSTLQGSQARVIKDTGIVAGDHIHIRDIEAVGGADFYAGANSADVSNNDGWIFNNSPGYVYGLGPDTTLCSVDPLVLSAVNFNGGTAFLWSTGSTNDTIHVHQSGLYSVTVSFGADCQITDQIYVNYFRPAEVNLGSDTLICEGSHINLVVSSSFNSIIWSDGSNNDSLMVSAAGQFFVSIIDSNNCLVADTIDVGIYPLPIVDLGKDTYICPDDSVLLSIDSGYDSYLWQDGSQNPSFTATIPGYYFVEATNQCGTIRDSILLFSLDCSFFAPNVFTPNGDGYNDDFEIVTKNVHEFQLIVYNRWGSVVFTSDDIENRWDGRINNQECVSGTYFYIVNYSILKASGTMEKYSQQGTVLLTR